VNRNEINVGVLIAYSAGADLEPLQSFCSRLIADVSSALGDQTDSTWKFHLGEPDRLTSDEPRPPSDFLDEASLRIAEGSLDKMVVVTDVGLVSRRKQVVSGLASPIGQVVVISTRKLTQSPRAKSPRPLESDAVRWNAAHLLLHLLGHLLGLRHTRNGTAMMPFRFDEQRSGLLPLTQQGSRTRASQLSDERRCWGGWLAMLWFHVITAWRHLGFRKSRAHQLPRLAMSLLGQPPRFGVRTARHFKTHH
jgi:hypothetical protein